MQIYKQNSLNYSLNYSLRLIWKFVWLIFCRFSPVIFQRWRSIILRIFGAKIASKAVVYPSCKIWAPWNLIMEENSCLGSNVDCYSYDKIHIGKNAIVSQHSYLCAASHDYNRKNFPKNEKRFVYSPN